VMPKSSEGRDCKCRRERFLAQATDDEADVLAEIGETHSVILAPPAGKSW
jgi:hypothetical protein